MVLGELLSQTLRVSYFPELISGSFGNGTVNESRYYRLAILMCLFRDRYILKLVNKRRSYLLENSLIFLGIHMVLD